MARQPIGFAGLKNFFDSLPYNPGRKVSTHDYRRYESMARTGGDIEPHRARVEPCNVELATHKRGRY